MPASQKSTEKLNPTEVRRQRFVEALVDGKSMRQAALAAGYSESMAATACRDIMPQTREAFKRAMHHRISIGKLSDTIAAGLDANETKFFQFEGQVTDHRDVVAWSERREYAKLAANLMSLESPKEQSEGSTNIEVNLMVSNVGNIG